MDNQQLQQQQAESLATLTNQSVINNQLKILIKGFGETWANQVARRAGQITINQALERFIQNPDVNGACVIVAYTDEDVYLSPKTKNMQGLNDLLEGMETAPVEIVKIIKKTLEAKEATH